MIVNFSAYGIYEYYSNTSNAGKRTGIIHLTMYFPNQDASEVARIITQYDRFIIIIQQNSYAFELFKRDIQPRIHELNKKYVIITCMDDATFPDEVFSSSSDTDTDTDADAFITFCSPLLCHWFAINCRTIHSKNITGIPYGIDLWTLAARSMWANTPISSSYTQDRHLTQLRESTVHFSKRTDRRIYINFHFNINGYGCDERLEAFHTIPHDVRSVEVSPVNRYETWGAYTQHVFVASPRGNGLDTIRTWEALMLGCIVIVRRIPGAAAIEELYTDLPVVVVDRWSDISRDFLDRILSEYSNRTFKYQKLTMEYWTRRIDAAFDDVDALKPAHI